MVRCWGDGVTASDHVPFVIPELRLLVLLDRQLVIHLHFRFHIFSSSGRLNRRRLVEIGTVGWTILNLLLC